MKQQTAVDWFIDNLPERFKNAIVNTCKEEIKQAKAIEKERIIKSHIDGFSKSAEGWNGEYGMKDFNEVSLEEQIEAEKYYNDTYEK